MACEIKHSAQNGRETPSHLRTEHRVAGVYDRRGTIPDVSTGHRIARVRAHSSSAIRHLSTGLGVAGCRGLAPYATSVPDHALCQYRAWRSRRVGGERTCRRRHRCPCALPPSAALRHTCPISGPSSTLSVSPHARYQ
eukprot:2232269-Rhodomonas_salina.1